MKGFGIENIVKTGSESNLTKREIEYLSFVATGYKNREIAGILMVTVSTVKKTLESIFRKFNAKDRAHAVTIAFIHNILTPKIIGDISKKYIRK